MSWSELVMIYSTTFVISTVVLGIVFLLMLDPELCRKVGRRDSPRALLR